MKIHSIVFNGIMYDMFYDKHLKLWASYQVSTDGYQVGGTEYWNTKESILEYLNKYGELPNTTRA